MTQRMIPAHGWSNQLGFYKDPSVSYIEFSERSKYCSWTGRMVLRFSLVFLPSLSSSFLPPFFILCFSFLSLFLFFLLLSFSSHTPPSHHFPLGICGREHRPFWKITIFRFLLTAAKQGTQSVSRDSSTNPWITSSVKNITFRSLCLRDSFLSFSQPLSHLWTYTSLPQGCLPWFLGHHLWLA